MSTTGIRAHLKTLKLNRMLDALDEQMALADKENWPACVLLERLLDIEATALVGRRMERRIKESKLDERKLLADFDFAFQTGVDQRQILQLATLQFVERRQWLILAGSSGTGKSHIAKALLLLGCQKLYRCRYTTASDMLRDLNAALADDSLDKKLNAYVRPEILLIDEIGFDRLEQESTRNAALFFKVIDGRYGKNATMVTTNISFETLGEYLGDPVVTAAVVDRMVHHAIIISIDGPSFRLHQSKALNQPEKTGKKKRDYLQK